MLDNPTAIHDEVCRLLRIGFSVPSGTVVFKRRPRLEVATFPHGYAMLTEVSREMETGTVEETYEFVCGMAFEYPQNADVQALAVSQAKAAGDTLVAGNWATWGGYLPHVSTIGFPDDEAEEPFYLVTLTFHLRVTADQ